MTTTVNGLRLERLDANAAEKLADELADLYRKVYGAQEPQSSNPFYSRERFFERLAGYQRAPGYTLITARDTSDELVASALMRQLAEGSIALHGSRHLAAFVLLADAIEALGRCHRGCQEEWTGSGTRLAKGLRQLERRDDGEFRTMFDLYAVGDIRAMRNFTTHGGTTPETNGTLDAHLSALLLNRFGDELTDYWVGAPWPARECRA
jgi:uncharacterized protein (DUF2267 family)